MFHRRMDGLSPVVSSASLRLTRENPIRSPVANAAKPRVVHKGLQEVNGVSGYGRFFRRRLKYIKGARRPLS